MSNRLGLLAGAAVLALGMGTASAATVDLINVTAKWMNPTPVAGVTIAGSDTTAPTARWGTPVDIEQSGYNFVVADQPIVFDDIPPSPTGDETIGTFTHLNFPITGTSLTSIQLSITAEVRVDGISQGFKNFVFDFTHDETPNIANPCAYGGNNFQGVNINGCADRVTVSYNTLSEGFLVGGDLYTLNLRGFVVGGNTVTEFITIEEEANRAELLGFVTLQSTLVPEPASMALLGMGLLGLGFAARRRA